jgi:hypothetical protein
MDTDTPEETNINSILETEKQTNKGDAWNKLDKTEKIRKLNMFAEKYGKNNHLVPKEIKQLQSYFVECLNKQKLQKTKDVVYDKSTREITSIPSLHFNVETKNFTLKVMDIKHVSTMKCLTPKRKAEKAEKPVVILDEITENVSLENV